VRFELTVNGERATLEAEPQELLLDVLRDGLGLTGAKRSCDVQVCGACTVLLDGEPVSACCTLAYEARGRDVTTIEGLAERPQFAAVEEAFVRHAGVQCGYCTPGMVLTIASLLESGELGGGEAEIRRALAGNICRCTGYRAILEAVQELTAA
jgi:aerobic-type carbon monoxide dehydrogenase small subunit (CoxS/CutS family)